MSKSAQIDKKLHFFRGGTLKNEKIFFKSLLTTKIVGKNWGKKHHLRVRRALSIYKWRRFASPIQGTSNKKRKAEKIVKRMMGGDVDAEPLFDIFAFSHHPLFHNTF